MLDATEVAGVWEEVVPSPESVTFRARQSGANQASFNSYTLSAKRKKLNRDDLLILGGVQAAQGWLRWQFWQQWMDGASAISPATLPCPTPKVGDVIEDGSGVGYVVKSVETKLFGQVFEMMGLKKV